MCKDLQNLLEDTVVNGSFYEEAAEADVLEAQRIITNALKRTHG
jgi:hypothetical protein